VKVLCMHAAGLGELVAASLTADLNGRVLYADDSAVMISTKAPAEHVGRLTYVKNSFEVIGAVPRRRDLRQAVDAISREIGRWKLPGGRGPYRLMFSQDGQLVGVPGDVRSRLTTAIGRATGGRFTPRGGGEEYWTITRRDLEQVLFCRRTPRRQRRQPAKGSLAPDVAEVVVHAAGRPRASDVILDPFAGSGALIAARAQQPHRQLICSDQGYRDGTVRLLPELAGRDGVRKLTEDARALDSVSDDSVDVVITDPPWGEYDESGTPAAGSVIVDALAAIRRVLRPGGTLAMLVARRLADDVEKHWVQHELRVDRSYQLLVNGHPATLLVGRRDS
jgi:predicted RNA methylase